MSGEDRIVLAHVADFAIGPLAVRPATREVARADGVCEVLEPRVMQVLVALARAHGAIVTRADLTRCCWEDRIVGEDAINRVISRLRRVAEGIGAGAFRVETITKVGYRLLAEAPGETAPATAPVPTRRRLIAGLAGAVVLAAGGLVAWQVRRPAAAPPSPAPDPAIAELMRQAATAMRQANAEGGRQAVGILRQVVALRPDYADGWGVLAFAYAGACHGGTPARRGEMRARGSAAAARAFALDPGNGYAEAARAALLPKRGNWLQGERTLRAALVQHPDNDVLMLSLSQLLAAVGRVAESARLLDRVVAIAPPSPGLLFAHARALWAAGRMEETDRAIAHGLDLYPSHFALWFTRFYVLLYAGRTAEALAWASDRDGRPTGIPDDNFDQVVKVARAILMGDPATIDTALASNVAAAHRGAGFAENTIQFASYVGRLDVAFHVAEAYFFDRGFHVADVRFTPQQGGYTDLDDRRTEILFVPSTAAMRADPRFARMTAELGLERYWKAAATAPDYRRA